jgi:hypothetical protein
VAITLKPRSLRSSGDKGSTGLIGQELEWPTSHLSRRQPRVAAKFVW